MSNGIRRQMPQILRVVGGIVRRSSLDLLRNRRKSMICQMIYMIFHWMRLLNVRYMMLTMKTNVNVR